ncbi:MAG: class I SAM-dependent RNA methyltransferase [Nitrospinota bacterium]|nr:class I SAM-dependent RNA methyltransferase [Nitrospinota bacterium]
MSTAATQPGSAGATHLAEIESIAAGGAGVARLDGRVVFIPRTVPGDSIQFRVSGDKGKFLVGELAEIASAGETRREPPCAHWAACGGCPLQQMTPESQNEAKSRIFLDTLARIGKIDLPAPPGMLTPPGPEFGYRMRARFQIKGGEIGFYAPGTRNLVPIESCLLVEEPVAEAATEISRLLRAEPASHGAEAVEITSLGEDTGEGAGLFLSPPGWRDRGKGALSRRTRRAWEAFGRANGWPLVAAGERSPEEPPAWTSRYELEDPDGEYASLSLEVSPESFIQPNRPMNRLLVKAVLDMAALPEGGNAVDLFCGAGNFALPLAGRSGRIGRVAGVEANPYAVRDAEANSRAAGLDNIHFIRCEAERVRSADILGALGGKAPDLALLDPPRRGALETIPLVMALGPGRIVYVSCNPATFARDAREIARGGYRLESALIAPMFPNSAHLESVTLWTREDSPAPD